MQTSPLTVIILSYNRHAYLKRLLEYLAPSGFRIIIMDGSHTPLDLKVIHPLPTDYYYEHDPSGYRDRLKKASSMVNSPYTMLMADDDLYSISAIHACLRELDTQEDLIACCGRVVNFKYNKTLKKIVGFDEFNNLSNHSVDQALAADRMVYHMKNYAPTLLYSVMRTGYWKKSMAPFFKKEFAILAAIEYQFEICASYLGKSKVIPELLWYRSWEDVSIRGTDATFNLNNPMDLWWKNPDNSTEHSEFLHIMASELSNHTQEPMDNVKTSIAKAMDAFCEFGEKYFHRPGKLYELTRAIYLTVVPSSLAQILRDIRSSAPAFEQKIREIAQQGVEIDWDEVSVIHKSVSNFHIGQKLNNG